MLINFNDTAKKLSEDQKVLDSYRELEPKYSLIKSLIRARINSGLSQKELAQLMHTSQSSIARLEGGGQLPSITTIFKYAKATNTVPIISFIDLKVAAASL